MVPTVPILILAAGSSSRMRGADKLLQRVGDEPLLRRQTRRAVDTGQPVIVALSPRHPDRAAALAGLPVRLVDVPDANQGMSRSLIHGLAALPDGAAGVMILPADMPDLTTQMLAALIAAFADTPDAIVRGSARLPDGTRQPGHPTIFPIDLVPALARVTGDEGGRSVIAANKGRPRLHLLPGQAAITDLDTPEDWAAWHDSQDTVNASFRDGA